MDDHLSKPLQAEDLDAVLQRWIGAGPAIIDRAALQTLTRAVGDEAIVEEIRDLFLSEAGPRLAAMEAAAAAGDAVGLRSHAHTLADAAGNVGAALVAIIAAELEATTGEADVAELLVRLGDALDLTRTAMGRTPA
jgi:HPt (histidine-containing phosphotransfer) domain-containing protein